MGRELGGEGGGREKWAGIQIPLLVPTFLFKFEDEICWSQFALGSCTYSTDNLTLQFSWAQKSASTP